MEKTMDSKVSAPVSGKAMGTVPDDGTNPMPGQGIRGFGSGRPEASTVNAIGGPVGKNDNNTVTAGPGITGFSNPGFKPGKI
jgi:hypothetical protein